MRSLRVVLACAAAILVTSSIAQANLLSNGSFETPLVPIGNFTTFPSGSAGITGWTVVGPIGTNVAIVSGTFSQNGVLFPAQDGIQWLDLTGLNSNTTEGVAQAVTTNPGDLYQLSYFIGNTTGGGIFGTTSTVNVSLNGVPAFGDTNSNASPTTLNWQQFTHNFVASAGATTLTFINGDPANDNSNGLDNVVLLDLGPASQPIPEPASLALFGAGLACLGLIRRRQAG
ncbi:DUF642 domain-containing protein [Limobrevibacterium gyesilva]|uniref:DUF642 domain-containing protein n=1 Tax=Limobrevibacterium gyesilva TaxID=2991712 RepID=A0AA42CJR4_9PROT|nr:DUF642 domain-containing protein [Limobrevibacterium gyesilva]MCW3477125.1 DUF642 domain-containing protein [Limobrevibacterium gyesilva]